MQRLTIHLIKGEKIVEKGKKKTLNTIAYIIQGSKRKNKEKFDREVSLKLALHENNIKKHYFTNILN